MRHVKITEVEAGQRADVVVAAQFPQYARSAVHKLFDLGQVVMEGQAVKPGYKMRVGEALAIDEHLLTDEAPAIDIPVLYEDDDVVVIIKPSGILSHSKGAFNPEGTVASWLRGKYVKDSSESTAALDQGRAGIVHRLDRATSGVMICAKNAAAQAWLQKQFSQRKVKKEYVAIVQGSLPSQEGLIDMPIARNPSRPQTFQVHELGKSALTRYTVLEKAGPLSLIQLNPETGRTHQLRVHLSSLGHTILGDPLYGGAPADRLYLHAKSLELTLPNRERKTFSAPVPATFKQRLATHAE